MEWGVIPKVDLEMKSYDPDPDAAAVILCDYGESSFNDDLNLVFKKHMRIKILTAKGYDWGTQSIVIHSSTPKEFIRDIEGVTYWLGENGEVEKKELESSDIFTENIDANRTQYRFTLPALKPGCIVEFRYSISTDNWALVHDWEFQYSEPVFWSEYRLVVPRIAIYGGVTIGYEQFYTDIIEEVDRTFSGFAKSYLGSGRVECNQYRWIVHNAPAIRNEPFITTLDDYREKVDLQLSAYASVHGPKKYLDTWDNVIKELLDNDEFGGRIDVTRRVRKQTEEIIAGAATPEEKMKRIYEWVASSIVWSGERRVFAEQEVNDVLDSKKGSNAEITFLLLSMLKSAGIDGTPVIVSTRDNGLVQEVYPIVSQFNYVLTRVDLGPATFYLDPTDPYRPIDLLPERVLNVKGLAIKKDTVEWLTFSTPKHAVILSLAALTIKEDGSCTGMFEDGYRDYGALNVRRGFHDAKEIDIAKDQFETDAAGITVDSAVTEGRDSSAQLLTLKAWVSSSTYAQSNGGMIYFNPQVINRFSQNPFKTKIRKFPVDYAYGREVNTVVNVTIPDSFEVKEKIDNKAFSAGENDAVFVRMVAVDSNKIQVRTKFIVKKSVFPPEEYQDLRNFYAKVVAAQSEQFVLARLKAPEPPQSVPSKPEPPVKKSLKKKKGK